MSQKAEGEKRRRFVAVDHSALREIAKHTHPGRGATIRSVWMAMETLAWEQRKKHHGRAFVTSLPCLAKISEVSLSTIKRASAFLEEIDLVTITRRKTAPCRLDFNHYALRYPDPIAHNEPFNSSPTLTVKKLVLHSKGADKYRPAATAASPLALRRNLSAHRETGRPADELDREGEKGDSAAAAVRERQEAEARQSAERAKRLAETLAREEAEQTAREQAEQGRKWADGGKCLEEICHLLERKDFYAGDYGGFPTILHLYRPEAVRWALEHLEKQGGHMAERWRQIEATMIKEGAIHAPVLATLR